MCGQADTDSLQAVIPQLGSAQAASAGGASTAVSEALVLPHNLVQVPIIGKCPAAVGGGSLSRGGREGELPPTIECSFFGNFVIPDFVFFLMHPV